MLIDNSVTKQRGSSTSSGTASQLCVHLQSLLKAPYPLTGLGQCFTGIGHAYKFTNVGKCLHLCLDTATPEVGLCPVACHGFFCL
jgi:hypothetical protein